MHKVKLSALLSTELKSRRKILEKWCIKISSKSTAGFLVAPRSLADSVHDMILKWTTIKGSAQTFKFHNQHDIIVHRQSGQQIATLTYTNAFNLAL
jgi:hypothetical protein